MLYADWLLTLGSWKQAVLTFGDSAPASGISVGLFFYSSGARLRRLRGRDPAARSRSRAERQRHRGRPDRGEGKRRACLIVSARRPRVTLAVFTFSLLGAMALGMPIAFALIVCGVALMHSLGHVRFADRRPEHHQRRRQLSADGGAVLHAGRRDHEHAAASPGASSMSRWRWSATSRAASATSPFSPPACWPRCRARPPPTPRRWPPCWCR